MYKFAVRLQGTGCWIEVQERHWKLWQHSVLRPMGFYTTRFVEAASPEEAAKKAVALVQDEVNSLHRSEQAWSLHVEEVWEDEAAFMKHAPGAGFTWFLEETVSP